MTDWKYYNHAVIPSVTPHENPDVFSIEDGSIWKSFEKTPLLARWTTEFDCGYETNWWYVIKDTVFDISELKAKRRYEINKGTKNFRVVKIAPSDYKEDLYNIQVAAFSAYPEKYRPTVDKDAFLSAVESWGENYTTFASFHFETGEMTGYALLSEKNPRCVGFNVLKSKPEYERLSVNAAIVAEVLNYYNDFLSNGGYICDGERSINHETAFQDYLEKYFGFRKAYCKLHIKYNPRIQWLFKMLFPFRKILNKFDFIGIIHKINAVIKMEEVVREKK